MNIDVVIDSANEESFHVMHFGNERSAEVTRVNNEFYVEMFTNDGIRHYNIFMDAADVRSFVQSWIVIGVPTWNFEESTQ